MNEEEKKTETAKEETTAEQWDMAEEEMREMFAAGNPDTESGTPLAGLDSGNWRLQRDAAALTREKIQEKAEARGEAPGGNNMPAAGILPEGQTLEEAVTAETEDTPPIQEAEGLNGPKERENKAGAAVTADEGRPLSRREQRQKNKEEAAAQKKAAKEEEARRKQEEREEKERRNRLAKEEQERKKQEKKEARSLIRQERRSELKSLFRTAELVMLIVFMVLAVDQAGIFGFLFVWLFVAVMAASVALLLLGMVRALGKKRCGIIFLTAIAGIIVCTVWFIYLVSSRGLGLGLIQI